MSEHSHHDDEIVGHEQTDAEIGPLVRFGIFLAVFTLATAALTVGFYRYLDAREQREKAPRHPLTVGVERPLPPAPRLQTFAFADVKGYRQAQRELLERYAWVDRNTGVVRIPVERAIEVLAAQGLPHRTEEQAGTEGPEGGAEVPPAR